MPFPPWCYVPLYCSPAVWYKAYNPLMKRHFLRKNPEEKSPEVQNTKKKKKSEPQNRVLIHTFFFLTSKIGMYDRHPLRTLLLDTQFWRFLCCKLFQGLQKGQPSLLKSNTLSFSSHKTKTNNPRGNSVFNTRFSSSFLFCISDTKGLPVGAQITSQRNQWPD